MTDREQAEALGTSLATLNTVKYGQMNFGHDKAVMIAEKTESDYEIWRRPDMVPQRKAALRRHKLVNSIQEMQEELAQMEAA